MDKTKVTIIAIVMALACSGARADNEFSWRRVAMDGSRRSDPARVEASPTAKRMVRFLDEFSPGLAHLKVVVGFSPREMMAYRPESPLGNWYADVMLEQTGRMTGLKCDLAIFNVGGIRIDMPKGNVTVEDINSMLPFKNKICIIRLRGSRLMDILEGMASSRSWEPLSNVRIVADSTHVISAEVGGSPLDPERIYSLVTNDFLFHGGDNIFPAGGYESSEILDVYVYQLMMDYLARLRSEGLPVEGKLDGRVVIRGEGVLREKKSKSSIETLESAHGTRKSKLTILHTNDTHSHIEPLRSGHENGMGGVIERAVFIDSVRLADGRRNVLLLDVGDFEQGTAYFSLFNGKAEIGAMNIMGYDVATMGNHELDNGTDDLVSRMRGAGFSNVLCNFKIENRDLARLYKPYVILRRAGLKIGIIGILADVSSLCDKDKCAGMEFIEPAGPVTEWATFLKEKKRCDLVIVLSHFGLDSNGTKYTGDIGLVPRIRNVDIIIGGHTHSNLTAPIYLNDLDGKPVMIVTDYRWGTYVGEIKY